MSEIALYNLLRRIPDVSDKEAKEAVADVTRTKEIATKSDILKLESFLKERLAKLEMELKYFRWVLLPLNVAIPVKLFF